MEASPKKITVRERYKQFTDTHDKYRAAETHVQENKEVYLFGGGIVVGIVAARMFVRPTVIVNNVIQQGVPA